MAISDLPAINASLNLISTVFICLGWFWIRRNIWQRHVPVHDRGHHFIDLFSRRLHCLSRSCRRKIVRLSRMAGCDLLSDIGFACSAGIRDLAARDPNSDSGFSPPVGSTSPAWPVDDADLALRFGDRRACLSDALQMVPAAECCASPLVDV